MAWPTTPVSTTHLDEGSDNPALARADIKTAVDAVNNIASEFGDVGITSAATHDLLQYTGSAWENQGLILDGYSETLTDHGSVGTETLDLDFDGQAVQQAVLTGNPTITFSNAGTTRAKSISLFIKHSGAGRTITFPAGTKFAFQDSSLSTTADSIDMIHLTTVSVFGSSHTFATILKGFSA